MTTIRVFLVDDHEVVRAGLRQMIDVEDDLEVVGEAATTQEALDLVPRSRPNVAVLDVQLKDGASGIELCRELRTRYADLVLLMLSSFGDDDTVLAALMAGAAGFTLKDLRGPALVQAIRRAAGHELLFDPDQHARLLERARSGRRAPGDPLMDLTDRESRVLELIGQGCTNRQIAEEMFLSEKTIKNYVTTVLRKLGLQRRTEAAVYEARRAQVWGRPGERRPARPPRPASPDVT